MSCDFLLSTIINSIQKQFLYGKIHGCLNHVTKNVHKIICELRTKNHIETFNKILNTKMGVQHTHVWYFNYLQIVQAR